MSENNESTVTVAVSLVDVGECPLCHETLKGELTTNIEIPNDKLNDTNVIKASMKMEAQSLEVIGHGCHKVNPMPEYRQRRVRAPRRMATPWTHIAQDEIDSMNVSRYSRYDG